MSEIDPTEDADVIEPIAVPENPTAIDADVWRSLTDGLVALERQVAEANADTAKDMLVELRDCVLVLQQRTKALRERIDQTFVAAIEAHGPIQVGPIRYVVGIDRTTRCTDTKGTTEVLLEAVGGDLGRYCEQLVAQPYKPASVRAFIPPEAYQRCFETVVRKSVEGEPVERLMKVDTRFVKPKG